MTNAAFGCLLVYWLLSVFRRTAAENPSVEIVSPRCERLFDSEIVLRGNFSSTPSDPVQWSRPDGFIVVSCQPGVRCGLTPKGYIASQENGGLNYMLVIASASNTDNGKWTFSDDSGLSVVQLSLSGAPGVNCLSDSLSGNRLTVNHGSVKAVVCSTECTSNDTSLSYTIQGNNAIYTPSHISGSTSCPVTATVSLNASLGLIGNYALCYVLTSDGCSYTQPRDDCIKVTFERGTKFSTTEIQSDSSETEPPGCWVPDKCVIANLVFAVIMSVTCGILLFYVPKKLPGDKWKSVIIWTLRALVVSCVVVTILLVVALILKDECKLRLAGVILCTINLGMFIPEGIFLSHRFVKSRGNRSSQGEMNNCANSVSLPHNSESNSTQKNALKLKNMQSK